MTTKQFSEIINIMASANGRGLRIIMALYMNKTIIVGHLAKALNIPQPAVSIRLKNLKNQKVVKVANYKRHLTTYQINTDVFSKYPIDFNQLSQLPEFQKDFASYKNQTTTDKIMD